MIWVIVVMVAAGVFYLLAKQKGEQFTVDDIIAALQKGGLLIDVRTSAEYQSVHAKGAKNVSLQAIQKGTSVGGDKAKPVYVYCHSGARARVAKTLLQKQGYQEVINIGSLSKWKLLGGKVEK